MASKIQLRRGTAAEWTAANPILSQGEFGYETDTGKFKIGNNSNSWTTLPYVSVQGVQGTTGPAGSGTQGTTGAQGATGTQGADGVQGIPGPQSTQGAQGAQGASGSGGIDLQAVASHIIPTTDITYDLGSPTNKFRDLYLSSNTLHLGDKKISLNAGLLEVGGSSFGESGNVNGVAWVTWDRYRVNIRVSTGSDADTIANSIMKDDILKLDSPTYGHIGIFDQLTVVSNDGGIVDNNDSNYKNYKITVVEEGPYSPTFLPLFELVKPIFKPPQPIYDIPSTSTGVFALPVGTGDTNYAAGTPENQRPAIPPSDGVIRYNSTYHNIECFINGVWKKILPNGTSTITKQQFIPTPGSGVDPSQTYVDGVEIYFGPLLDGDGLAPFNENSIMVYKGREYQIPGDDYEVWYSDSFVGLNPPYPPGKYLKFTVAPNNVTITVMHGYDKI